jgi:hypothetical protein
LVQSYPPRDQPDAAAVALQAEAAAVVLDLVEPVGAKRDAGGLGRDAEIEGLKHAGKIGISGRFRELRHGPANRQTRKAGPCPRATRGYIVTRQKPAAGTNRSFDIPQTNRAAPLSVNFT